MYKFIKAKHKEHAVTEADIKEVEERFGVTFPTILREFYLEYNGDSIQTCFFTINEDEYTVDDMHYIKVEDRPSVESVIQWEREDGYIPANMIPFAYDCGGESYYWNTENGNVYFINGEDIENPQYVCESISEFFKLMEEAEPF